MDFSINSPNDSYITMEIVSAMTRDRTKLLTGEVDLFATLYTVLKSRAANHTWTYPMLEMRSGFMVVKKDRAWYETSKGYLAPYTWTCWLMFAGIAFSAMITSMAARCMYQRKLHIVKQQQEDGQGSSQASAIVTKNVALRFSEFSGIASESMWLLANKKLYAAPKVAGCTCQDDKKLKAFNPPMSTKLATLWFGFLTLMMIPLYRTHLLSGILVAQKASSIDSIYDILDGLREQQLKLILIHGYPFMSYYRHIMDPTNQQESVVVLRNAIQRGIVLAKTYEEAIELARNDPTMVFMTRELTLQPYLATNCDLKYIEDPINGVQVVSFMLGKQNMALASEISTATIGLASYIYQLRLKAFPQKANLCGTGQRAVINLGFKHIQAAVYLVVSSGVAGVCLVVLENVVKRLVLLVGRQRANPGGSGE